MRLLRIEPDGSVTVTEDYETNIAPYAILSHTWGPDQEEVSFEDIRQGIGRNKVGYHKIEFCAKQAKAAGLQYCWVDTCCIDKSNQVELSTAITSMFGWYAQAEKCYVFISDISSRKRGLDGHDNLWKSAFERSVWFTRGWTLQELLAPQCVEFYSCEGDYLGSKSTLENQIQRATNISAEALRGARLSDFTVEDRMRWACNRKTKKVEDQAYCLTGIFGVCLVPNYGEGGHAFVRLKTEIADHQRRHVENIPPPWTSSAKAFEGKRHSKTVLSISTVESTQEHRRMLVNSLSFGEMESRRATIRDAYSTTCRWLLAHSAFVEWLDPRHLPDHHGFLWISGNPGAGKSTLMKFAYNHARKEKLQNDLVLSFFFNARGARLERSVIGMYRALLHQIVDQAADLESVLDDIENDAWTADVLCKAFSGMALKLGQRRLKIFVDALDECDAEQIQVMVVFFEELGTNAAEAGSEIYMCFASRHYPTISIQYGRRMVLEAEQGHGDDVTKYLHKHLRAGQGKFVTGIKEQILEKANGIFMWVVLVVQILNIEFKDGRHFAVTKRLEEIPPELSDLFRDIVRRDQVNRSEFLLCLQWILFAARPLAREEFYAAMAVGSGPCYESPMPWDPEASTEEIMTRYVQASSKGLAELTKSKTPRVQFIHESVRDFLLKEGGLNELQSGSGSSLDIASHEQLKLCCQNYIKADLTGYVPGLQPLPQAKSESARSLRLAVTTAFPFLGYASQYLLHHAEEAVSSNDTQTDFLGSFPLDIWIRVTNIFQQHQVRRHTTEASLLYILAEANCAKLIRSWCSRRVTNGPRGERYFYPLFAALANKNYDAVRSLLSVDQDDLWKDIANELDHLQDVEFQKGQTPLQWALVQGFDSLAKILASSKDLDINAVDKDKCTALHLACQNGHEVVVRLLVEKGVDVHVADQNGSTALHRASERGHEAVVRLLVEKGVDVHVADQNGYTALYWASQYGHETVVRLLVEKGADIHVTDQYGSTALYWASQYGHEAVIRLLVEKGADIHVAGRYGFTALHWASERGHEAVVRLLVEKGADIHVANWSGFTALHWASSRGHEAVVRLLVENGADTKIAS